MPIIPAEISTTVVEPLNITPSTSSQTYTPTAEINGYGPVSVSAVTSSIDANITAGNIKSGVSILGVSGSVTELNGTTTSINPSTSSQTVTPTSPNNGFTSVTVPAVTSSIDANIQAGNIKDGVTILGVTGNYQGGGGGGGSIGIQFTNDNGTLSTPVTLNLTGITDIGDNVLRQALINAGAWGVTSLDLSNLTAITGDSACDSMCIDVMDDFTSCDLSNVQTIGNSSCTNMFAYSSLSSIDLGSLQTIGTTGCMYMFGSCTELTSLDLSSLQTIGSSGCMNMCEGCEQLATVDFSSLSYIATDGLTAAFSGCLALTEISFPALTTNSFESDSVFINMLQDCEEVTLHFPSNIQGEVEALDGYPDFGGTDTTVLFDLPATE